MRAWERGLVEHQGTVRYVRRGLKSMTSMIREMAKIFGWYISGDERIETSRTLRAVMSSRSF